MEFLEFFERNTMLPIEIEKTIDIFPEIFTDKCIYPTNMRFF